MRRFFAVILLILMLVTLTLNNAFAEPIKYSERCLKIKQAERAILEKYQIEPEMYTFFVRDVSETDDGRVTVTLRGQDVFYWVLGTYTASSDGTSIAAAWNNEGKETDGGFDAPAWGAVQLHRMIVLSREEHDLGSFFPQAVNIARRDDPHYTELRDEDPMLIYELGFEMTVPHPDHATIKEKSRFTREQMNEIAITAIAETYELMPDVAAKICEVDSEPDFRYEIKNGQLIYRAWMELQQNTGMDAEGFGIRTEHDGQYLVVINAETGIIEDVVYDAVLNGA